MGNGKVKNRWLIAASAVGIHISIGSVYAWSVFSKPIVTQCGWSLKEVQFTFSLAILFLGLSAAFFGRLVERRGPRTSGMVAAVLFGLGVTGSGLAVALGKIWLLYLFYGVLGGMGLGIGYIAPVSTLVKWFPDRRGLATGLAIMGFGFAALLSGPLIQRLIAGVGLSQTFFIMGPAYFGVMFLSSLPLAPPEPGWSPSASTHGRLMGIHRPSEDRFQLSASEALRTRRFYWLWLMLYINITCGIAVISVASPMGQELIGMSTAQAAAMVGVIGLFNGGGRLAWAAFSDYIGRANTYTAFFLLQIVTFFLLPRTSNLPVFEILLFLTMTCYGGGFACVPAFIGDMFGTKQLAAIHGYILTAWAAAGMTGPMFAAWVRENTGTYSGTLSRFIPLFVAALVVSLIIRWEIKTPGAKNATDSGVSLPDGISARRAEFPAELESLEPVRGMVVRHAREAGLPSGKIQRLELAAEEVAANICTYAYLEEAAANMVNYAYHNPGSFSVAVEDDPESFRVVFRDRGNAFNPLTVAVPDLESPLEDRDLKNLGIHLVRSLTDSIDYLRQEETNVLTLTMTKEHGE